MQHLVRRRRLAATLVAGLATTALAAPALAHHPLGGATPATLWHGLLSGVGHPVIGFDHLAFVIAVGIASTAIGKRNSGPAVFVGATVLGCLLTLGVGPLAGLEMMIAASVAVIGVMVLSARAFPLPVYLLLFAIAGALHGGAYAGAIVGAEATPVVAYLAGFASVQYAVAIASGWLVARFWSATSPQAIEARLAGAVIAGVGLTFLVEHIEQFAFPGV